MTLIERFLARWQREIDYWWRDDPNVYPFEHIVKVVIPQVIGKTPTMMLIEAIEHYADAASSEKIGLSRKEMLNIMRAIRDKARMALALCA